MTLSLPQSRSLGVGGSQGDLLEANQRAEREAPLNAVQAELTAVRKNTDALSESKKPFERAAKILLVVLIGIGIAALAAHPIGLAASILTYAAISSGAGLALSCIGFCYLEKKGSDSRYQDLMLETKEQRLETWIQKKEACSDLTSLPEEFVNKVLISPYTLPEIFNQWLNGLASLDINSLQELNGQLQHFELNRLRCCDNLGAFFTAWKNCTSDNQQAILNQYFPHKS